MCGDPNTKGSRWFFPEVSSNDACKQSPAVPWADLTGVIDYQTGASVKQKQPAYQAVWQLNARHQIQWGHLPVQLIFTAEFASPCPYAIGSGITIS